MPSIRTLSREQDALRTLVLWGVLLGVIYAVTGNEWTVIGIGIALGLSECRQLLGERSSIDIRWVDAGYSFLLVVGSAVWLFYELSISPDGTLWLPSTFLAASLWLLLDTRRDFVEDVTRTDETDDVSSRDVMVLLSHGQLVVEELKSGPKTKAELAAACDLTDSRVDDVLDTYTADGTIYPVDAGDGQDEQPRYAVDESRLGKIAFLRINTSRALSRLLRPLRL